ncbi:hypothetical protein B0H11DRAFT_1624591, partial [Mycena galericulata]
RKKERVVLYIHSAPARPLQDAVCAYLRLDEDVQISAENIIVCGDSASAELSLVRLMYLCDNVHPVPTSVIFMSPW